MFPTMCFLESLFLIIFSSFTLSSSIPEPTQKNYSLCAPFKYRCGYEAHNIYYPFRLPTSPDYCGNKEFELKCTPGNKSLAVTISNKEFHVNSIDYNIQIFSVTDLDFVDQSCVQTFTNTSINPSLFSNITEYVNLSVFFNCSPANRKPIPNLYNITCPGSASNSFYKLPNDPLIPDVLSNCKSMALVPIDSTVLNVLMTNYVDDLHYVDKFMWGLKQGFNLNWTVGSGWCSKCTQSEGICWSDPNSQNSLGECYCSHGPTGNDGACVSSSGRNSKKTIIVSVSAALLGFLVVCILLTLYFYKHRKVFNAVIVWKKNLNNNQKIEALLEEYGSITPRRYSYSNVKKITKAFQEKLGQGGYGTVFKGTLDNGHMVAVKILNDSKGDGEEFINEVASIGRTSHVNVVSLLGFCYEGSKRALVYDFMCNGSLDKLLNLGIPKTPFDWEKLYQIAIGIARGLEYLHRGCNARIVHFDIKPHNILLDQDFCPKISDFGLAKLCLKKESMISIAGARGTIGYIAPEVFSRSFGVVSSKSDVYSFGMMVLEITGGTKNPNEGVENSSEMYFPHWIYAQLHQNGDLSSCGVTAESEETVRKMVLVGLWCIQTLPQNRPSMSQVIEMMEGSVDDLQIPPKPYLLSSPFGSIISTSSIQDTCSIDCVQVVPDSIKCSDS